MKRVSIKNKIFLFLLVVCFSTVIICSTLISKNKNEIPSILTEMKENAGEYNTNKIVLNNTTKSEAKSIATRLNAKLRINKAETFATITLPDDLTVYEICKDPNNKDIVDKFSLDYHAKVSEIEDTVNEYLPSRPLYNANDEYYDKQTYLDYINLSNTWGSLTGYGVTVAIIDTGIDTDHPEFVGRISEYSYNATEDKIVKDYLLEDGSYDWSLIEDVQGHGTSVAGVIGASLNNGIGITGIAPNVELLVIKAECDEKGAFYSTSDLVFGLYYAIERDADVVNMSFGIKQFINPFAEPAQLAKDSDIICVAAAGNDGEPTVNYPAGDPNVIGVGALASNSWELANYSNYGDGLDVVAPGTVYTTAIGGGYQVMNGTSFSSPIVAASIALYISRNPYQELKDVYELLTISSKDLGDIGKDFYYGYGALDINAMINEEKGVVTFNYLTNEIENTTQRFIRNHTLQQLPEPERLYAVFDGWYYDIHCTEPLNDYIDKFSTDLTLYAKWINEDDGVPFTYKVLNDDTVEITGYRGKRKFITVPSIIDGKTVSSIGKNAFKGETKLRRVTLPETIKSIGEGAFYNCINLTSMVVPDSVIKIGESAFRECIGLVNISFNTNSKLEYIGNYAFSSCLRITALKLPKNVSYFNGSAVYGTTKLTKIEVDKDNKYFKSINGVLYNSTINTLVAYPANKGLSYEINNKTKIIGQFAFACGKVEEVNLKNVEQIGDYAFLKSNIKSADLSNVFNVGISIYTECMFLENVNLGDKIDKISAGMFSECISLKEINIPKQVQEIGISGFARSGLEKVIFLKFSELKIISKLSFIMTSLIEIEIPSSVVYIGEGTFSGSQLKNITFAADSQLSYIGELAFEYTAIERVQLPNKLIAIGNYAFKNTNLKNVSIPSSVVQLGNGVFASCYSLTSIDVEDNNENYVSLDGVVYSKDLTHLVMYPGGKNSYPYVVNENTKVINDSAFYGAYALIDVQLNNGLEEIDQYAFYDVQNVCTYKLPSTLVSIGNYAFSNNKNLEYVNIPDSVLKIGRYAFMNDYNCYRISFNETSKLPRISYGTFA